MIRLKSKNVEIRNLCVQLKCAIFDIALTIQKIEGENYEMIITSGNDGLHKKESKHYTNEAIDIRCRDMKNRDLVTLKLKALLGSDYDVINEFTHIHIEYDPK